MEPQLVDYYNDFPSGAILIENLNSEYEELQKKYDELEKKYNSIIIIPPKVRVSNVEEFYNYENKLEELKEIIKEVFNSERMKGFIRSEEFIEDNFRPYQMTHLITNVCMDLPPIEIRDDPWENENFIFYPIFNKMNIITKKQKPEWCKQKLANVLVNKISTIEDYLSNVKHRCLSRQMLEQGIRRLPRFPQARPGDLPNSLCVYSKLTIDNVINIVIDDIIRHHEWSPEEHKLADLRILNCERCGEEDDRFPDKGDLKLLCKKCS